MVIVSASSLQPQPVALPPNAGAKASKPKLGVWRIYKLHIGAAKDPGKDYYLLHHPLFEAIASRLRCRRCLLPADAFTVVRKSFDARKGDPRFIYTVEMDVAKILKERPQNRSILSKLKHEPGVLEYSKIGSNEPDLLGTIEDKKKKKKRRDAPKSKERVAVVGSGPAGLFAALVLAGMGVNVVLVERGYPVEKRGRHIGGLMVRRVLQQDSNFCYGEGGAGTWSDGKLTTRIGKNSDKVRSVLQTLVRFGAPETILLDGKPHVGTDRLVRILRSLRAHLESLGVTFMFGTRMEDILVHNNRITGIQVLNSETSTMTKLKCDAVVLAVGHSARDVYDTLLSRGVQLAAKDFSVGLRVEHPQEMVNEMRYRAWASQVQKGRGKIPVADYQLAAVVDGEEESRQCYSFCMCPGGQIVPTSTDPLHLCINGMSFSKRSSKWANAALVVNITPEDIQAFSGEHGPLVGVAFQKALEREAAVLGGGNFVVPAQILPDYLEGKLSGTPLPSSSYRLGVRESPLHELLPARFTDSLRGAIEKFDQQMHGFIDNRALLHGVETRTSSPVTIVRDEETYESVSLQGLYPIGEGAGYAGGIVSAAVDGMEAGFILAKRLIAKPSVFI